MSANNALNDPRVCWIRQRVVISLGITPESFDAYFTDSLERARSAGIAREEIITFLSDKIITHVACGWFHTVFLASDGKVYSCGYNSYGQLGLGNTTDQYTPVEITFLSNKINNQKLTDAHTCYKLFDSALFKSINLKENDFSFCPEITTKLSILGLVTQF